MAKSEGCRVSLTWTETFLFSQFSKPRAWTTPSRAAAAAADTPGLLSIKATLEPCTLYFPWGKESQSYAGLKSSWALEMDWAKQSIPLPVFPRCPKHLPTVQPPVGSQTPGRP